MIVLNKKQSKKQDGYIALIVTIIISMVLLVMIAGGGFAGWRMRFIVLGTEHKEQSGALAEGCIYQAFANFLIDQSQLVTQIVSPAGRCDISIDNSSASTVTVYARANVGGAYTNIGMSFQKNSTNMNPVSWLDSADGI